MVQLRNGGPISLFANMAPTKPNGATHVMFWESFDQSKTFPVFVRKTAKEEQVWEDAAWRQGTSRAVAERAHQKSLSVLCSLPS